MAVDLSDSQKAVIKKIWYWFHKTEEPYLTMGGYAGTGKTTLVSFLSEYLRKKHPKMKIAFCSYTGKAARVLSQKLNDQKAIRKGDYIGTIHRLIYAPVVNDDDEIVGWDKRANEGFPYRLIIVDEASMLNRQIWDDLLSYNIPILAVGDHGQLPPIEGSFNLMQEPQLRLEEIYRQEEGNPIIAVAQLARNKGYIPVGTYGNKVKKLDRTEASTQEFLGETFRSFSDEMMVLVGYNSTRQKTNQGIREILEYSSPSPQTGDRVICLKNNHEKHIYNGMLGTIVTAKSKGEQLIEGDIMFDGEDELFNCLMLKEQFGSAKTLNLGKQDNVELFDFAYAITVHKAQGSQAEKVIVFEERFPQMDDDTWRRWLYTAVTRATQELYVVGD